MSVYGAATTSNGFLGSGVVLDSTHVLTAAHVVDFFGGVTPEGATTGDGQADALMPYSRVYLNNIAAPDPHHTRHSILMLPACPWLEWLPQRQHACRPWRGDGSQ